MCCPAGDAVKASPVCPSILATRSSASPCLCFRSAVHKGVQSFPNESAPGPSGLHTSQLQEAVGYPSPDQASKVLATLTWFINLLAAGRVPSDVNPHLCCATLLASRKKKGGHRPIAVGEVLRRLVSKCLSSLARHPALACSVLCSLE